MVGLNTKYMCCVLVFTLLDLLLDKQDIREGLCKVVFVSSMLVTEGCDSVLLGSQSRKMIYCWPLRI